MKSYLDPELFIQRPIVCAASKKKWTYIAKQHPRFDWESHFDDVGSLVSRQQLFVTVMKEGEVEPGKIEKGLASCLGVEVGSQTLEDRKEYLKVIQE